MSCVPITPDMDEMLGVLTDWPISPETLELWRGTEVWTLARRWGWVMESGELTGMGSTHAIDSEGGSHNQGILPHT